MILGCVGKWAIHPSQIEHALEIYSPKPEDIARARKLEKAYAEAEAKGLGAINVDGIMVDVASIRILRNTILNKADLFGCDGLRPVPILAGEAPAIADRRSRLCVDADSLRPSAGIPRLHPGR